MVQDQVLCIRQSSIVMFWREAILQMFKYLQFQEL